MRKGLLTAGIVVGMIMAIPVFAADVVVQMNLVSEQGVGKSIGTVMISESSLEGATLEWFMDQGYRTENGPKIAPGEPGAERIAFGEVALLTRLKDSISRLNPAIPEEAREEAQRKVLRVGGPSLTQSNRAFHRMLRNGVEVEPLLLT